ncbi:trk system potassium uptake protein TrkH [Pullulanibacillus pueri]|uniref:Ktr system potassium uptake protein B n=1 Tax=Pullulanibacillus pueri TaxID=1437324 RepID=A0A8J2ZW59_9BACL|nr:TrkH family potassium uptake protein [Pullulanibacillus pueri]MBM7682257.1 trk system potassium uptake protein TrkH [Pullulanibacillus pueri]GGH81062.1 ktr system potassium uptake protein B [Pullulanibacillus pueri]
MKRLLRINWNAPQLLTCIYCFIIAVGSCLLMLPFATTKGISFLDTLFTATSAITVTGLIVVDTGHAFTLFGQMIILILIQLGGLGIMSFAVFIYILLGRKIGLKERILIQQSINQSHFGGIIFVARRLLVYSLMCEFVGALFLACRWIPELGWAKGIYAAIFHSISAFNNAGFSTWSDSLSQYVADPIINFVISALFIIGGLGFTVLLDIWNKKTFRSLTLQTKLMIYGTLLLNFIAVFAVFILEYSNPHTLGHLSLPGKLWASYFQGVVPRTAGFNTIDIGNLHSSTLFLMCILMFIGAGSGSTGGGIKLTTFIAMVLCVVTFLRGKSDVVIFNRTIPQSQIIRSLSVAFLASSLIFTAVFVLIITEKAPLIEILFEAISAFGTVGMSMGLTASLTCIGKIVIMIVMFIGKLGPLTLAFSFIKKNEALIRHPEEDILTG